MQPFTLIAGKGLALAAILFSSSLPFTGSPADAQIIGGNSVTRKVAVVHYDPTHPTTGQRLSDYMGWADANARTSSFVSLIQSASGGYLKYQVVDFIVLNKFPDKRFTSATYTWASYQACRSDTSLCIMPDDADYHTLMNVDTNLASRIQTGQVDEVWVYGGGYFGFDEFAFKIPDDQPMYNPQPYNYWLYDGRKKDLPATNRTYFVMGWILENGFDNQIHSYGHRIESTLALSPPGKGFWHRCNNTSAYTQFICIDQDSPGAAACGDIHYPPNATQDYQYNSTKWVRSNCESWENFPHGFTPATWINAAEWGKTQEGFLSWWLSYLPASSGTNQLYGDLMRNNWWYYIAFYDAGGY